MTKKNRRNEKGIRVDGKIYHEGRCIGRINDANLDEFEEQIRSLRKKFA